MKFIVSILLYLMPVFVFTTVIMNTARACGTHNPKSEVQNNKTKCPKNCCTKSCSHSKNKKKNCCGNGCSCSVSIVSLADLPKQIIINKVRLRLPLFVKSIFFYEKAFQTSATQDIWQPPIIVISNS